MDLVEISAQLNAAVEAGEFDRAVELACEYRKRFDDVWAAMPCEARKKSELPEQALQLHQQAIGRLVDARAEAAAQLRGLQLARPYGRRAPKPEAWHMAL